MRNGLSKKVIYEDVSMGDYLYTASEILYNNDPKAYESEYNLFLEYFDN